MAEKKKSRGKSFIVRFCIVALCAYFAISLFSIKKEIADTKAEITAVQEARKEQEKKNSELREIIESGDIDGYAESIARDKLGFVKSGERVYYDISVNN